MTGGSARRPDVPAAQPPTAAPRPGAAGAGGTEGGATAGRRVVLDANVWVSGILFRGTVRRVVEAIADGKLVAATSPVLLDKLRRVFSKSRFHLPEATVSALLQQIETACEIFRPTIILTVIKADPTDNRVLECAVAGRVDGIISGDKHLRELKRYERIPIWTPAHVVSLLNQPSIR